MIINKLSIDGVKNSIVSIENETQKRSTKLPGITVKYIGGPTVLRPKRSITLHRNGLNSLPLTNEKSRSPLGSMRIRGASNGSLAIEICDD